MRLTFYTSYVVMLNGDQTEKFSGRLCNYSNFFQNFHHAQGSRQFTAVPGSSEHWNMTW